MFKLRGSSVNDLDSKEQATDDRASTFSCATTLKSDTASETTLTPDDQASIFSSATPPKSDAAFETTLTPGETQKKEKEKAGILAKLEAKKDELLKGTPMGRSNALQKQMRGKGRAITASTPALVFMKIPS